MRNDKQVVELTIALDERELLTISECQKEWPTEEDTVEYFKRLALEKASELRSLAGYLIEEGQRVS